MLTNLPMVTQLRGFGWVKALVCHMPSCFLLLGFLGYCSLTGIQRFLEALKCTVRACEIASSFKRPVICLSFRLWPGEVHSLVGRYLSAVSGCGQELQEQVVSLLWWRLQRTGATLANHSSAFARDVSKRGGCGFQESQEEACKLPSGKCQG